MIKTLLQATLFVSILLAVSHAGPKIYPTCTIAELCAAKGSDAKVSASPAAVPEMAVAPEVALASEEVAAPAPVDAATTASADDAVSSPLRGSSAAPTS